MDFKYNEDIERWRQSAEEFAEVIARARHPLSAEASPFDPLTETRNALQQMSANNWQPARLVYTLSYLDADSLLFLCKNRQVNWQTAFNAKACFGPVEDLQKIYDAAQAQGGVSFNLYEALNWSSRAQSFGTGFKSTGCLETTDQILKWGANPSYDSGRYFQRAVEECGLEMGKVFARNGLTPNISEYWMKWARDNNKGKISEHFREIYWEYGRYTLIDSETLMETKHLDPANSNSSSGRIRTIFNFASGRVGEIYEWPGTSLPPQVKDFSFDNYSAALIDKMRNKLIEFGGNPPDTEQPLKGKKPALRPLQGGLFKDKP